jgi:hypothetical protein
MTTVRRNEPYWKEQVLTFRQGNSRVNKLVRGPVHKPLVGKVRHIRTPAPVAVPARVAGGEGEQIWLFIGMVPKDMTCEQLAGLFEQLTGVASAAVIRNETGGFHISVPVDLAYSIMDKLHLKALIDVDGVFIATDADQELVLERYVLEELAKDHTLTPIGYPYRRLTCEAARVAPGWRDDPGTQSYQGHHYPPHPPAYDQFQSDCYEVGDALLDGYYEFGYQTWQNYEDDHQSGVYYAGSFCYRQPHALAEDQANMDWSFYHS